MSGPAKILLIAEMREGWSFSACEKALLQQGHQVKVFNVGDVTFPMARSLFWRALYKVSKTPVAARMDASLRRFLSADPSFAPDLIFLCKGDYLLPETLQYLKRKTGALLFNWHTDDYFSPTLSSPNALRSIPLYDCIFVHTRANLEELLKKGARRVEYLPHGADPALYHPLDSSAEEPFTEEAVFIGNWRKERAVFLEKLVAGGISHRLAIWGHQWDHLSRKSPLRPYTRFAAVAWEGYGRLLRSAKINLVFLTRFDTGRSVVPLRLFEIPAAGGFMLVERGLGQAAEFFREGEEMICFDDISDLQGKIPYYLSRDSERRRIALAAQRRTVESGYFYSRKMEQAMQVYHEVREKP